MDTIHIIIERKDPSTGNRYTAEEMIASSDLDKAVIPPGQRLYETVQRLRANLDAKEKKVRTSKPHLP
jgi:hypothetical protein